MNPELNNAIIARGKALFTAIADDKPSLFDSATWLGRIMKWCLQQPEFKTELFRFIDVFPALRDSRLLVSHIEDYFGTGTKLPPTLARAIRMATRLGPAGSEVLAAAVTASVNRMAHQFIIAEATGQLLKELKKLHHNGFGAVVDLLGEATLSHAEADRYLHTYLELLTALSHEQQTWGRLPGFSEAPMVNLAVKPTALLPLVNPMDFEGSVTGILEPLRRLTRAVVDAGAFLCIDMESYRYKDITLEVYRRLKREFPAYPHLGVVLQAYLHDTEQDLAELLGWAGAEGIPVSIRLVKGAYWDYETVRSAQHGTPCPVRTRKSDTDAAFERLAARILSHHHICRFACATHNIRSIAAVLETAHSLNVPEERYEFQMLYGMAEPIRRAILSATGRVRLYCPYGELVPGMGYLVRRLLENSANESFLRLSFNDAADIEQLLADPAERPTPPLTKGSAQTTVAPYFRNEPTADFTRRELRAAFPTAIAEIRAAAGKTWPLLINGQAVITAETRASCNPNRPSEIFGMVCQAGPAELEQAITAAAAAFPHWRTQPADHRATILRRAAAIMRERLVELAAWQVLEIGKQWDQAHADVAEAIDFLDYYAAEMVSLSTPQRLGELPGEENYLRYEPYGVAAVIAPWNFPLAIATGMTAAALVTGNTVLFKPSGLTPIIGSLLVEILHEAGLPPGVCNYLPGSGDAIGDQLVDHPDIALLAFTGSLEVGSRIVQRAALLQPGQRQFKRVIAELGGKNAIIIDDDADFDEAIPQVLASAFGFQGQKCSACSRLIVLDDIYDRFVARLVEAAATLRVGPAEDPACAMGAVADMAAQRKIKEYIALGRREGSVLYQSPVPDTEGYWVPLTIIGDIRPEQRLAQEEVFGPLLAVLRATDFVQAVAWANTTGQALTGGLFSRSPRHIEQARRELRVGNLYINRSITGAMVARQPFGGAGLSGLGTKAGGADYLRHFMNQRVITEHTMRRGFTPLQPIPKS